MPLQPFFQSATGDPTKLVRMFAWQDAQYVPQDDPTVFKPFKGYGGALAPSMTVIERQRINRSAQRSRSMHSKMDYSGQTFNMGDLDPADTAQLGFMLQLMQGYSVATASGRTRWRLSQDQAVADTAWDKLITYLNDTDKGLPARFVDVRMKGFSLALQGRANAALNYEVRAGKMDFWDEPTVTGTGTVKPILRHFYSGNLVDDATNNDITITIVSDSATAVTFTVKVGAGSASANQIATKGVWTYLMTGSPAITTLGPRRNQIQIYFPTGADNTFVDADVWVFPNRRTAGLGVTDPDDYPTSQAIAEVQARFYLGGVEIPVDNGVTLTVDVPGVETRYAVGGEQPVGTDRKGQATVQVSLDRRLVDLELQTLLLERGESSLVIECVGDSIIAGGSGLPYGVTFVLPLVIPSGEAHDAQEGAQNYNEQLTLIAAQPDSDFTGPAGTNVSDITDFAADIEVVWDTDIDEATLTA